MDWETFQMARQLLTEEVLGRRVRGAVAAETADFQASLQAMSRRG